MRLPDLPLLAADQLTVACCQHTTRLRGVSAGRRAEHSTVLPILPVSGRVNGVVGWQQ